MFFNQTPLNPASSKNFLPVHGGALNAAAEFFNIPRAEWLDISTGINPTSWPVPEIPTRVWQRLPEEQKHAEESLESAALAYYLASEHGETQITVANILSCAGSQ